MRLACDYPRQAQVVHGQPVSESADLCIIFLANLAQSATHLGADQQSQKRHDLSPVMRRVRDEQTADAPAMRGPRCIKACVTVSTAGTHA